MRATRSLKTLFLTRAEDCARGARELQDVVQRLGGAGNGRQRERRAASRLGRH